MINLFVLKACKYTYSAKGKIGNLTELIRPVMPYPLTFYHHSKQNFNEYLPIFRCKTR